MVGSEAATFWAWASRACCPRLIVVLRLALGWFSSLALATSKGPWDAGCLV